jgi:hypothetical protein
MTGQAVRRMARARISTALVASGDGAPAAQGGNRGQGSRLRPARRVMAPVLGAGITVAILAGTMMAAGPAAASPAAPAAHAAAGRSTPASRVAARLNSPVMRRLVPWGRAATAGARAMSPQARAAAARTCSVSTGRSSRVCPAPGGRSAPRPGWPVPATGRTTSPGRAVGWHLVGQADHPHPQLRRPAGWHADRRRVLHVVQRVRGRGLLLQRQDGPAAG